MIDLSMNLSTSAFDHVDLLNIDCFHLQRKYNFNPNSLLSPWQPWYSIQPATKIALCLTCMTVEFL